MSKPGPTLPFRVVPPPPAALVSAPAVVAAVAPPSSSSSPPQPASVSPAARCSSSASVRWRRVTWSPFVRCHPQYGRAAGPVRSQPAHLAEADVEGGADDDDQEQHARIAEPPAELGHVAEVHPVDPGDGGRD